MSSQPAFICRLCLTQPRFVQYEYLRAHIRAIHSRPKLSHQELPFFEVFPGSRYLSDAFASQICNQAASSTMGNPSGANLQANIAGTGPNTSSIGINTSNSVSNTPNSMAVVNQPPENRSLAVSQRPNEIRSTQTESLAAPTDEVVTIAQIRTLIRTQQEEAALENARHTRDTIQQMREEIQTSLMSGVKQAVSEMLKDFVRKHEQNSSASASVDGQIDSNTVNEPNTLTTTGSPSDDEINTEPTVENPVLPPPEVMETDKFDKNTAEAANKDPILGETVNDSNPNTSPMAVTLPEDDTARSDEELMEVPIAQIIADLEKDKVSP